MEGKLICDPESMKRPYDCRSYDAGMARAHAESGQSRTASLLETATHITIGFVIALWLTGVLFPGISYADNARVTTIFTAVSLVRGFVIRRIFNFFTTHDI